MIIHPKRITQKYFFLFQIVLCLLLLGLAIFISLPAKAQSEPLGIARVSAPDINCIFDQDCTITVSDNTDEIIFAGASGSGFLQSRLFPQGETGTAAEGQYAYLYRIDLRNIASTTQAPCIFSMRINFGPLVPIDYDGDEELDDLFVVVDGAVGTVAPNVATEANGIVTLSFANGVCGEGPGEFSAGESSVFMGLTSRRANRPTTADLLTNEQQVLTVDARTPVLQCERILSPDELDNPNLISFEDLPNATTIGDLYRAEFGVRFEESATNNAIIYGNEPSDASSPPNTVINNAVFPNTSDDVPLLIQFDDPQTHVGFYIGNGNGDDVTGVLTAFNAENKPICTFAYPFVPDTLTMFAGVHNPDGEIAAVTLDYGGTLRSESIDELYFVAAAQPDLIIESLTVDSIMTDTISYSYVIRNIGDAPVDLDGSTDSLVDDVDIQAFLSQDEIFNNEGDSPAGGRILGAGILAPTETFSGTFSSSTQVDPTTFAFLTLMVDWGEAVFESNEENNRIATPIEAAKRVRVCREENGECVGQPDALLYKITAGESPTETVPLDEDGYALNSGSVDIGESFWAMQEISQTGPLADVGSARLYLTSGLTPTEVLPDTFANDTVLKLYISEQNPLLVRDLVISAQWTPAEDADYRVKLTENLTKTSNYFHDFTDGQFALGNITVHQNYDNWDEADLWLHADNNQRPLAVVGGMVEEITDDISPTIPLTYASGHIYMGSEWNRYFEPPGDIDIPEDANTEDDWALALAHELGHYNLFLWDTYFGLFDVEVPEGKPPKQEVRYVAGCTGTAMGYLYEPQHTEFIFNQDHWDTACVDTFAYDQTEGRTEWEIINAWYPWTVPATMVMSDTLPPPIDLTTISFIAPTTPTVTLLNQTFDLLYEGEKDASDRARAYIIRGDRIIEQGQPAEKSDEMTLTGAAVGDRFCLFDIKNVVPGDEFLLDAGEENVDADTSLRHQYGCKILDNPDDEEFELDLERDRDWEPVIEINYIESIVVDDMVESQTVNLSITMPLTITDLTLRAKFYPEHEDTPTLIDPFTFDEATGEYNTTVSLPGFAPSLYLQLWVTEDDGDVSETNPRREAIVGSGVKGSVVPGPASWLGGAPIIGPENDIIIVFNEAINLGRGQFIAIQETYAIPRLPANTTPLNNISGYRLTALPGSLITDGSVSLRYLPSNGGGRINAAGMVEDLPDLSIYYWDGGQWSALDTTVSREEDGHVLANAPLEAGGIYALLENVVPDFDPEPEPVTYLPFIANE